jgi:hypothetical protein
MSFSLKVIRPEAMGRFLPPTRSDRIREWAGKFIYALTQIVLLALLAMCIAFLVAK